MPSSHANRVQMTVSGTPGTGTITLGSASSGYRTFASAYGGNATVDVLITDGTAWEVARGCTYTHSGTTLSRGTLESSSTGSAISLTSSAIVSVILTAGAYTNLERVLNSSHIDGLTLSNNATDAANDIDIAAGTATVTDGTDWYTAKLTESITKRLDASWAVGTNQGGLDTGAEAVSTWYHVWLIQRSDTGVVDALFSTSASAPTMPTSYDRKRRIGSVYNDSSGALAAFSQVGDEFLWNVSDKSVSAANPGTSAVLRTLLVPLDVKVIARVMHSVFDNSYASATYCLLSSPDAADRTPAADENTLVLNGTGLTTFAAAGPASIRTNTSSQIRSRLHASDADRTLRIQTIGWADPRGRT